MQKMGWLGGTQGQRQCRHSIERYDFLFDFNRNHASILYRFRDIAGYWSKVAYFDPPHLHSAPSQGGDPGRILRRSLASENQSPRAIVWCCLCDPTFCRFSRTPTSDGRTDRRTDGRTQGHGQYRGCIASRGKNWGILKMVLPSGTVYQTLDFTMASRSCCQQNLSTFEVVDHSEDSRRVVVGQATTRCRL